MHNCDVCIHNCLWDKNIRTSRGSPPEFPDLLSSKASDDFLPIDAVEFEWLFRGDARERGDALPSTFRDAQESLLCNRKWSSTSIKITIAFSTKNTESCAAFSASALASFGDKPSAATPAEAEAITWVCYRRKDQWTIANFSV